MSIYKVFSVQSLLLAYFCVILPPNLDKGSGKTLPSCVLIITLFQDYAKLPPKTALAFRLGPLRGLRHFSLFLLCAP